MPTGPLHGRYRGVVRARDHFPSDDSDGRERGTSAEVRVIQSAIRRFGTQQSQAVAA